MYTNFAASYTPGEPPAKNGSHVEEARPPPPPPPPKLYSASYEQYRPEEDSHYAMHRSLDQNRYGAASPRTNGGGASYPAPSPLSPASGRYAVHQTAPPMPPPVDDDFSNETLYFERNRIKQLQDERVVIQKKTFTKWCNSFLNRARLEVGDLFTDLSDGVLLMKLLEIISGEKLGKPNKGKMRVQKVENLNHSLNFLKNKRIQLENIGAEDILDRNERLILGLIWTIILRFQIDTITIDVDENETGERKQAKDALLIWCQRKTAGYAGVKVENFTTSWRSGLAFNALIHAHRPDLINYNGLNHADHIGSLNNAFDVAEKKLEIARLLDAEDVDTARPDEKSIITYVSLYYHYFAKQKTGDIGARRIGNIVGKIMGMDASEDDYETISSELLEWIRFATAEMKSRNLSNSLKGIQDLLVRFNEFRTVDKPPKYKEKGDLEALFFAIQTKRKGMSRKAYVPPRGRLMQDIEAAWEALSSAESERQAALLEELLRQQRLERLAERFAKKAQLRDAWLREMGKIVEQLELPRTATEVEATLKKHQAISADILPREERFRGLSDMCADLCKENYHESDRIRSRERDIIERWTALLSLLDKKRQALESLNDLMTLLRDLDTLSAEMTQLEPTVRNRDVGRHMMGVDDLLHKHELLETQIHGQGAWLEKMSRQASGFIRSKGEHTDVLQRRLDDVKHQYGALLDLAAARRTALMRARELFQFVQDDEEEMAWLAEKEQVCKQALQSSDISHVPQIARLHKNVETEMQSHWARTKEIIAAGERLIQSGHPRDDISMRTAGLQSAWDSLRAVMSALGQWLADAHHAQQYFQDANEAESWIREKMPLVKSDDFGKDETAAEKLLQRHTRLEEEIHAYRSDIVRLDELAQQLASSHFHTAGTESTTVEEETDDMRVPTIKMLYKFENENFAVKKDEILALLEKSTGDWWRAVKQDGTEGYVPANYCREEPGMITVTTTRSKKTSKKSPVAASDGRQAIVERQKNISTDYRTLNRLADERRRLLSDQIKLMRFYRECDEFETWTRETERALGDEPTVDNVEEFARRFEKLENDIRTNGGTQLKRINDMAEELLSEGHSQSRQIEARQRAVNAAWAALEKLRAQKAARLATVERIAEFDSACDDVRNWMKTKYDMIERNPNDLKSLQNLERDLKPLEDRMRQMEKMAKELEKTDPEQAAAIRAKMAELAKLHEGLLRAAEQRIKMAQETQGQSMFEGALRDMHVWIEKTKKELSDEVRPLDVAEAEEQLKKHRELGDVIKEKKYEVEYVNDLGKRLLDKNPRLTAVKDALKDLDQQMHVIHGLWRARDDSLRQHLDLQLFNREAERIDAASKGHEAFLDYADLGDSVESVENLLKRHKDLEAKLDAQEQRLAAFSRGADKLIGEKHSESAAIDHRRREVLERRAAVRRAAAERKRRLDASLEYQSLKRDGQEMLGWIAEKKKLATDDAHRDLTSIETKLLKHEAFEAELRANAPRVEGINKEGAALVNTRHYESANVSKLVDSVNSEWAALREAAERKAERLKQASEQKGLNRVLEDAHTKLDELEAALRSKEYGADLRGTRELIKKHAVFEQELHLHERRLGEIAKKGEAMAGAGHFDGDRIQRTVRQLLTRFHALEEPTRMRRIALDESLQWHQLAFDVDCELQWIAEKEPLAASEETGRTLTEAVAMLKKHEQLEAELAQHVEIIEKTIGRGRELVSRKHPAREAIHAKCDQLSTAWNNLSALVRKRKQIVDWGIREQQYLADAAEVESWMAEKRPLIESEEYGQDEDAAQKLLAKHKALQNDMQTYKQWLEKLGGKCAELVASHRPHVDRFSSRQSELEKEFSRLSQLAEDRRRALEDALCLYEYLRESADLEQWINDQLQTAMSEDYGDDYDHLMELQNKFTEFKQAVKTGTERFRSCEAAANSILRRNPPFARDILKRQEKLRSVWTLLVDYIEGREAKLKAAEELHRFNRDVAEHEEAVAEKQHSIPKDLGRDVKQVHSLWQKHEVFEKQVGNLETQLQRLLEESARLKAAYPGGNADHISAQQAAMTESWQDLKEHTEARTQRLKAAYDLHRFVGEVRDLVNWSTMKVAEMQSEQNTHDLQGAEYLQKEHQRMHAEIDGRQGEFGALIQKGEKMIAGEHYAAAEIRVKCKQVEEALARLRSEWQLRASYLAQVVQWHAFQREAKQILSLIHSKSATLRGAATGATVEEVEGATRRLDTFDKGIAAIRERVTESDRTAAALVQARHMERTNIETLQRKVHDALRVLDHDIESRRSLLASAFRMASLQSDIVDMEAWIEERLKAIRVEAERQGQLTSIEDKMKRLQRHQAFEAEMASNKQRVDKILRVGRELASTPGTETIRSSCDALSTRWRQLEHACHEQSLALEEARDLLAFKQLVHRVLEWVREKEQMVASADMGHDLEHCRLLIEKLDGSQADSSIDEQTLEQLNRLGEKLIHQGRSSRKEVQAELAHINEAWRSLHGKVDDYRMQLQAALEVHVFTRDVDDTNERIHEKTTAMRSEEFGRDFAAVDALVRKQKALERDMGVIHQKLIQHDQDAQLLLSKKPPLRERILAALKKLEESWKVLADAAEHRNIHLDRSYKLHKYLDSVRKAEQWSTALREKMNTHSVAKSAAEARALLETHSERKAEIDARQEELKGLHEEGQRLVAEQPDHKAEVQRAHKRVQNSEHQLRQTWESKRAALMRLLEYQLFCEQASQVDSWLTGKEAFLNSGDLGETPDAVQLLIKKHEGFEQTLTAQSEKVATLRAEAEKIGAAPGGEYSEAIGVRVDAINGRHNALLEACRRRRVLLADSLRFHEFLRSCSELITWITAKLQMAYDESYLDPTNLRSKLQRHLAFDSELAENEKRLHTVVDAGENLIREHHYNKEKVAEQLREVRGGWEELKQKSMLKTQRLRDAYEAHQLQRKIEDMERWLDKVETELASDDHGRDLHSVEELMRKVEAVDAQIKGRADAVEDLMRKARELRTQSSSSSESLLVEAEKIDARYKSLAYPVRIRGDNLREARKLFVWQGQAAEELEWLADRLPLARSIDCGDSLHAAESLAKKHTALENELESRQSAIHEVEARGAEMVNGRHFAAHSIQETIDRLASSLLQLRQAVEDRNHRLKGAILAHKFYTEVAEAEHWIKEKMPLAANQETGRDAAAAASQERRLTLLDKDVNKFREEVDRLAKTADRLVAAEHRDATQIQARKGRLETSYSELVRECNKRRQLLQNAMTYHDFVRKVDTLVDWLREKEAAARSEDYGRDLEDCDKLIEAFETIVRELAATGERVAAVQRSGEEQLRANHPYAASIRTKGTDLQILWTTVNETANERKVALAGARLVHKFDQEADETSNWLQEKEALGVALEQEDIALVDLAGVKRQMQKHDEFMHGMKAAEKQVRELCAESERLEAQFPQTRAHIEVRRLDMQELLRDVLTAADRHYKRLCEAERLQAYFQEHRELMAWMKRMQELITSERLARDVAASEALMARHHEYSSEMKARRGSVEQFVDNGRRIVQEGHKKGGHVLAAEITEKVESLERNFRILEEIWKERFDLYEANLDVQRWLGNATQLEKWLEDRQGLLREDWRAIESVDAAESQLRVFDDFLVTLDAQGDKFEQLKRLTLIEQNFSSLRKRESEKIRAEEDATKKREEIRQVAKKDLLRDRKQERERRKTQEISLMKPAPEEIASQTLPRQMDKRQRAKTTAFDDKSVAAALASPTLVVETAAEATLPRSTPAFTTRRQTSLRKSKWEDSSSIDMKGFVDRKHHLGAGGIKATIRSWKNYYSILCGQLLCFFKDEAAFDDNVAAAPPINIYGAVCQAYPEYVKRRHAFRVATTDNSEFLFACADERQMHEWVNKIKYHAGLPPSSQLRPFSHSIASTNSASSGEGQSADLPPPSLPPPSFATMETTPPRSSSSRSYHDERHPLPSLPAPLPSSSSSTDLPTLHDSSVSARAARREARRAATRSVYESVYGAADLAPIEENGFPSSSVTSTNGHGEERVLSYHEAMTTRYEREERSSGHSPSMSSVDGPPPPLPRRNAPVGEGDFAAWVESCATSSNEDADSIKSGKTKKGFGSFFKRSSKSSLPPGSK